MLSYGRISYVVLFSVRLYNCFSTNTKLINDSQCTLQCWPNY